MGFPPGLFYPPCFFHQGEDTLRTGGGGEVSSGMKGGRMVHPQSRGQRPVNHVLRSGILHSPPVGWLKPNKFSQHVHPSPAPVLPHTDLPLFSGLRRCSGTGPDMLNLRVRRTPVSPPAEGLDRLPHRRPNATEDDCHRRTGWRRRDGCKVSARNERRNSRPGIFWIPVDRCFDLGRLLTTIPCIGRLGPPN